MTLEERISFKTYLRELGRHVINVYSILSWVIALVSVMPIWKGQSLLWLTALFAVVGVVPASFRAWQDAVKAQPIPAALLVREKSAGIAAQIDGRVPQPRSHFDIRLDISNPSTEPVDIAEIKVEDWQVPESVFSLPVALKIQGYDHNRHWGTLTTPIRLLPKERRQDIGVFIDVDLRNDPAEEFAKHLVRLNNYSFRLVIKSENPSGMTAMSALEVKGDFWDFQATIVRAWKDRNQPDLLIAAGDLDLLLERVKRQG
jgi:hypothetical protein